MTNTLIHDDCLRALPNLADNSVDMVFADLPYGVTANKWDTPINLAQLWPELLRVGKRNCAYIFTATQPFASTLICSQRKLFRYDLVWDKVRAGRWMHAKRMPLARHEAILIFYRNLPYYAPQMVARDKPIRHGGTRVKSINYNGQKGHVDPNKIHTHKFPDSLVSYVRDSKSTHPTQKPVALLEWLIKTYSNDGDTILDPTAGSMTTAVAATNTGRKYVCIEKDAEYYRIGAERVAKAMAPPAQAALDLAL